MFCSSDTELEGARPGMKVLTRIMQLSIAMQRNETGCPPVRCVREVKSLREK